jgi:hypothetical protein
VGDAGRQPAGAFGLGVLGALLAGRLRARLGGMKLEGEGKLLRIFIGESDQWHHRPLYEEIVRLARDRGMAGAPCCAASRASCGAPMTACG